MKRISGKTGVAEIAAIVSGALADSGLSAILSGGSVVSIYSKNEYESYDLDFVTDEPMKALEKVMTSLGFKKKGRHFTHPGTDYFVEFPPAPLALGNEPVSKWAQLKTKQGIIQILTPTQCVMDRLAAYYAWNDKQSMEQAVIVAKHQPIDFKKIEAWSKEEGELEKFSLFQAAAKKPNRRADPDR